MKKKEQTFVDDIEKKLEEKISNFQIKMKSLDNQKTQGITLSLITKYSFTRQFKNQLVVDDNETAASETTSQTEDQPIEQYQDNLNAEKMIYLKTIRLGFLAIGPKIENLEIFEHVINLYLQSNKIQEIGIGLKMNVNLMFLALQNNQIKKVEGISHLKKLGFLDLSYNQIEDFNEKEFPENIMILKMNDNPCAKSMPDYRKKLVVHLPHLEELDRIKVIEAERLAYKGLIKIDVEKLIEKYKIERNEHEAKERMEKELYLDYMTEIGAESSERMMKSLEEFAKLDEFSELRKQFNGMLREHKEKSEEQGHKSEVLKAQIDRQVTEVMERYSRQGSRS